MVCHYCCLTFIYHIYKVLNIFRVNVEQWRVEHNVSNPLVNQSSYDSVLTISDDNNQIFWSKLLTDNNALIITSILMICMAFLGITRLLWFFRYCLTASTKMHNEMLGKILHSPMLFFNTNPIGRILNRFSKDVGSLDESLPKSLIDTIGVSRYFKYILNSSFKSIDKVKC